MASIHQSLDTSLLSGIQSPAEGVIQVVLNQNEVSYVQLATPSLEELSYVSISICYDALPESFGTSSMQARNFAAAKETMHPQRVRLSFSQAFDLGQFEIVPFALISTVIAKNPFPHPHKSRSAIIMSLFKPNRREKEVVGDLRVPNIGLNNFVTTDLVEIDWMLKDGLWLTSCDDNPNIPAALVRSGEELLRSELLYRYGNRTPYSTSTCDATFTLATFESFIADIPVLQRFKSLPS